MTSQTGHRLIQLGFLLFLVGLLTGFAIPMLANPRMGLSSHLEGVLNGMFLIGLGLVWSRLRLGRRAQSATFWIALYGTFANWAATFLAAVWGAGAAMPIAAGSHQGSPVQEMVITGLLFSLSLAMVIVCGLVLWGLRGSAVRSAADSPGSLESPKEVVTNA